MPGTLPAHARASGPPPASVTAPMSPAQCRQLYKTPCYDAQLLRHIYGLDGSLARDGVGGRPSPHSSQETCSMTSPLPHEPGRPQLRIGSVNLQYGGLDLATGDDSRWQASMRALAGWDLDVVLVQEMTALRPWGVATHLWRTANALGMIGLAGPPVPGSYSGGHTAILVNCRRGLQVRDAGPPPAGGPAAWAHAVLDVPGMHSDLHVYSVHLPAGTATGQREQAEILATRIARNGALTVAGGDWNCYVPGEPALTPGYLAGLPPHLRPARMHVGPGGRLEPNYDVHGILTTAGLTDLAAALPPDRRTPRDLAGTGLRPHGRIDRFYGAGGLAAAAESYLQARTGGSDHQALLLVLDMAALAAAEPPGPVP
jgi:endonuclease/exonuclease/phosphatase family metal-dependent hydrolase